MREAQNGVLCITPTPIGNLEDITLRALNVLKSAYFIAAEDTRHTRKLLNHYSIKTRLLSYREQNSAAAGEKILDALKNGFDIALVSDAGTPLVCDPGFSLVNLCRENNIPVTALPGASAILPALILSGFDITNFTFFGFFPRNNKHKKTAAKGILNCPNTAVFYEAPHRLAKTLKILAEHDKTRRAAIISEISKIHEKTLFFTLAEAAAHFEETQALGEYVIVIEKSERPPENKADEHFDPKESVLSYMKEGLSKTEAVKRVAKERNVSKNEVYRLFF